MNKVLLIILDGFGLTENKDHNAIYLAQSPNWDRFLKNYPWSEIKTSGRDVGLPKGIMGNSEVGHMSIGAGRVIPQDVVRIDEWAEEKGFDSIPCLKKAVHEPGCLHFVGLVSDGCVHSSLSHLEKLLQMAEKYPDKQFSLHAITDGRDTAPKSGINFISKVQALIKESSNVTLASVGGRYYAMDRDKRWSRIEKAYRAMIGDEQAPEYDDGEAAVRAAYHNDQTDEFITPRRIRGGRFISSEDQVLFFNYRADRARQLSRAFAVPGFEEFETPVKVDPDQWLTMTNYDKTFPFPVLFPPQDISNILAEVVSRAGGKQLRIAETEKYAHVTYYLNCGREKPFEGEERILIPSPQDVDTYDEKPEMSVMEITDNLIEQLQTDKFDLIVVNFANGDMVGHTGDEEAAIQAVEAMDRCLGRVVETAKDHGYHTLITADHGNCEQMRAPQSGEPFTQHTTNPVPLVWISKEAVGQKLQSGRLADIAPTVLTLMGVDIPDNMSGKSLKG